MIQPHFTYSWYKYFLKELSSRYKIVDYHYKDLENIPVAILRHDIDNSIKKALEIAEIEAQEGIKSTYFVLLRTDFYNVASKSNQNYLQEILSLGHEIGLHFDELAYETSEKFNIIEAITDEAKILGDICRQPIRTVSMHRPSKKTLESNYFIPSIVNSYSKYFFEDFKYLSDSRRFWREPVLDIIQSQKFDRLHILTHAFWYNEEELSIKETIRNFVNSASFERYNQEAENIKDIDTILSFMEIK